MVTLNLTYVNRTERISKKTNKPFTSISIKCKEYNDNYLSGFGNADNKDWKEGMTVEVAEVTQVEKDGKIYHNFVMPKKEEVASKQHEELINILFKTNLKLDELLNWKRLQTGELKPERPYPVHEGVPNFDKPTLEEHMEDDGLDQLTPEQM